MTDYEYRKASYPDLATRARAHDYSELSRAQAMLDSDRAQQELNSIVAEGMGSAINTLLFTPRGWMILLGIGLAASSLTKPETAHAQGMGVLQHTNGESNFIGSTQVRDVLPNYGMGMLNSGVVLSGDNPVNAYMMDVYENGTGVDAVRSDTIVLYGSSVRPSSEKVFHSDEITMPDEAVISIVEGADGSVNAIGAQVGEDFGAYHFNGEKNHLIMPLVEKNGQIGAETSNGFEVMFLKGNDGTMNLSSGLSNNSTVSVKYVGTGIQGGEASIIATDTPASGIPDLQPTLAPTEAAAPVIAVSSLVDFNFDSLNQGDTVRVTDLGGAGEADLKLIGEKTLSQDEVKQLVIPKFRSNGKSNLDPYTIWNVGITSVRHIEVDLKNNMLADGQPINDGAWCQIEGMIDLRGDGNLTPVSFMNKGNVFMKNDPNKCFSELNPGDVVSMGIDFSEQKLSFEESQKKLNTNGKTVEQIMAARFSLIGLGNVAMSWDKVLDAIESGNGLEFDEVNIRSITKR